jgi:hypothetical protein
MALPVFTIGHSTRPLSEFIELLAVSQVGLIVDVRTIPRSRTNPQYNRESLPASLAEFQIAYEHIAQLAAVARAHRILRPTSTPSGRTRAFTTMPTMRWATGFVPALPSCANLAQSGVAP